MMVKIEAVIRPERVNVVTAAMEQAGCKGFNLTNITGQGQQQGIEVFTGRGGQVAHRSSLPKVLVATVVPESQKDTVVQAIVSSARTGTEGAIGDGKIFVSPVSEVIRVRTGERDLEAL